MGFEPDILRLGKAFGVDVQVEYPKAARDVLAKHEVDVAVGSGRARWLQDGTKVEPTGARLGRKGRIDLLLTGTDEDSRLPFLVVLEVKRTDWDRQANDRVAKNVGSHRRQVWRYLEPLVDRVDDSEIAWVQGALVYPSRPATPGRAAQIEELLAPWGISVLWYDELTGAALPAQPR